MRFYLYLLLILSCNFCYLNSGAQSFTLKNQIEEDLSILKSYKSHNNFVFHGVKDKKTLFSKISQFKEISEINLSGYKIEEDKNENFHMIKWTNKFNEIKDITELTYTEKFKNNTIILKRYIIEKKLPPYKLTYISMKNQGLINLEIDDLKIIISYESILYNFQETWKNFQNAIKREGGKK
jgi:hypothetical protein